MMSWRRNFIPYLLCDRPADKCFVVWWIEAFSCNQSTKGFSTLAPPPRFLVVSHLANDATEHNASNPYCHLNPCTCPPRSKLNHLGNHGWLGTGLRRYRSLLGHRIPANAN